MSAKPMKAVKTGVMASQYRAVQYDPSMLQINLLMKGSSMTTTAIANKSGVSRQCIRNWLLQKTRRPQALTMRFVLRAMGYDFKIVPTEGTNRMPPKEE